VYGHIVVDEAQELSELEWRMLMRRCPGRFMTVVGDFAQAGGDSTVDSWEAALAPYVGDRFALHTLTVNYRTTAEILAAAAGLLTEIAPGQRPSRSIRHGEPPRTVTVAAAELTEAVAGLVAADQGAHPGQLTGVVCPPARVEPLQRRVAGTGAVVVAAPEARGLEFDAVVLVDPAGIRHHRPAGVRDLYVATTRATRRLVIVEVADGADG
jgi:DNA helicase IV